MYWNCRVSDFGVKRLGLGCRDLKVVNFSGCKRLTDRGVIPVVEACPKIEILNLTRLTLISDETLNVVSK